MLSTQAQEKKKKKRPLNEMFVRYPLHKAHVQLSTGESVTVPYHVYNGWASAVIGCCDLEQARKVCEQEDYQPVETDSGKALGMISFWEFGDANAGPHTEFQFTLLVSTKDDPIVVIPETPFATSKAMALDPRVHCMIAELYNNTSTVVAYNNEIFALNAILANTHYSRDQNTFQVETADGKLIAKANFGASRRLQDDLSAVLSMLWHFGYKNLSKLLEAPYAVAQMTSRCHGTPPSKLSSNVTSLACTKIEKIITQWYDPQRHQLELGTASHTLHKMQFNPTVVFHYEGIDFCYLCPIDAPRTF
ncbi:expressed unknown protein [Seminavis robusta]|uniref:Uncharacterized protein n=1 Tax=Seminavis robusta TaxID=568900 RepID=A0A9N8EYZ1_9STRA|nr:expressed unknown protein [Seminavis robusta]|eukprot:Sro2642_g333450.1 n/a (305) ;mRNA; r:4310-5224